jgi:hypothetical protein
VWATQFVTTRTSGGGSERDESNLTSRQQHPP